MEVWVIIVGILVFLIGSGGVAWIVSIWVAPAAANAQAKAIMDAARVQADSTIQAAKQETEAIIRSAREQAEAAYGAAVHHAIRGEQLKIRASVMQRRLAAFNEAISDFLSALLGANSAADLADKLDAISWRIAHNAILTAGPHEETMVREMVDPFIGWCRHLQRDARKSEDLEKVHRSRAYQLLMEGIEGLARVVDWAAEKRIEQTAYLPVPGADLLPPEDSESDAAT